MFRSLRERRHTYLPDGDNARRGLNQDPGFTGIDRIENIRRVSEAARPYDRPDRPKLRPDTEELPPEECIEPVMRKLKQARR